MLEGTATVLGGLGAAAPSLARARRSTARRRAKGRTAERGADRQHDDGRAASRSLTDPASPSAVRSSSDVRGLGPGTTARPSTTHSEGAPALAPASPNPSTWTAPLPRTAPDPDREREARPPPTRPPTIAVDERPGAGAGRTMRPPTTSTTALVPACRNGAGRARTVEPARKPTPSARERLVHQPPERRDNGIDVIPLPWQVMLHNRPCGLRAAVGPRTWASARETYEERG